MYLHKNFKRGSITFPNQIKALVLNLMMMQHKNFHINEFWTNKNIVCESNKIWTHENCTRVTSFG